MDNPPVKVGKAYKIYYGKNNPRNIPKLHILAIVDDYMVVCKHWLVKSRAWTYHVRSMDYFVDMNKIRGLTVI